MSFTLKQQVEIEQITDCTKTDGLVAPRWQRKALAARTTPTKPAAAVSSKTPSKTPKKCGTPKNDRFIPNRAAMDFDLSNYAMTSVEAGEAAEEDDSKAAMKKNLAANVLGDESAGFRVLALTEKAPAAPEGYTNAMKVLYSQQSEQPAARKVRSTRHIPAVPERILDAPDLVDDYYLNLLDWSSSNTLAVALGQTVYLWNAATGTIEELMETKAADDFVCSVSWIKDGAAEHLAIGTNNAEVQLWDVNKGKQLRSMKGHTARVGALDWNSHVLSSGSRDSNIFHHDVRIRDHHIGTFKGHELEVCSLKWSHDGMSLASGSNDNALCIWDNTTSTVAPLTTPRHKLTAHSAAVKALAWCPWQKNTLASGGGTADRCIKFWNASNGAMLNSIDTGSQVCSLAWNPHDKEILSSHGFSQNQLCLWSYPSMAKLKELNGHTSRVLHMAVSPDGSTVCSAAADETLRFWRVFGETKSKMAAKPRDSALTSTLSIR